MNDKIKKPPLGIMPRFIHESQRIEEIITSIMEHIRNDEPIPDNYAEELIDRTKGYNKGLISWSAKGKTKCNN